jgi:hypothetical protein
VDRTLRAALLAAFIGFAFVAGILLFLQVPAIGSISAGLVVGLLSGLLIWGAGRRADSFHPADEVRPVDPGFPGPPEHDDHPPEPSEAPETRDEDDT